MSKEEHGYLKECYCPIVSFRSEIGYYGFDRWVKCLGRRCMFFDNGVGRCSVWMIGNSLWRNIDGRKLEEHEGRDVKK